MSTPTDLEKIIRDIVRDEIRKVFSSSIELPEPINRQRYHHSVRGSVRKLVCTALLNGPLSTSDITRTLYAEDRSADRGALATAVRNAVWGMNKKGLIVRGDAINGKEWIYSLPSDTENETKDQGVTPTEKEVRDNLRDRLTALLNTSAAMAEVERCQAKG